MGHKGVEHIIITCIRSMLMGFDLKKRKLFAESTGKQFLLIGFDSQFLRKCKLAKFNNVREIWRLQYYIVLATRFYLSESGYSKWRFRMKPQSHIHIISFIHHNWHYCVGKFSFTLQMYVTLEIRNSNISSRLVILPLQYQLNSLYEIKKFIFLFQQNNSF